MAVEYREEPCRTALNKVSGMGFGWSLNPYMGCAHRCTFCYVRGFERRADRPSDDRYGRSIRVKTNIAQVLAQELRRPSWRGEHVAIGTATDPYQPAEGRYRLTRACLEVFVRKHNPASIITRSPMVIRDIDLLREAALRGGMTVSISIPTLDRTVWRVTEPGTAPPHQRLKAIRALNDAGIRAGVAMAPILPGISDSPSMLADVVRAAREAGAPLLWCKVLHLTPGTREHFMENLARDWPELVPRYEDLYTGKGYLPASETEATTSLVEALRVRYGVDDRRDVRLEQSKTEQRALL
jgi:DNA repair photolyase